MKNYKKTRYCAVVESGSCTMDRQYWSESINCGNAHKTFEAAEDCLKKKQQWYCDHGRPSGGTCKHCISGLAQCKTTDANWYNGTIHTHEGERA